MTPTIQIDIIRALASFPSLITITLPLGKTPSNRVVSSPAQSARTSTKNNTSLFSRHRGQCLIRARLDQSGWMVEAAVAWLWKWMTQKECWRESAFSQ